MTIKPQFDPALVPPGYDFVVIAEDPESGERRIHEYGVGLPDGRILIRRSLTGPFYEFIPPGTLKKVAHKLRKGRPPRPDRHHS